MSKIQNALNWMIQMANDPNRGYDQEYRWGERGDYDCSSAVISAWEQAGVPLKTHGATYTGNMENICYACGFSNVTDSVNLATGEGLQPGDICLNRLHHVAMAHGDGRLVHASINELGRAVGGQPGDQTGREFCIRSYYNYPWNVILRYSEKNPVTVIKPINDHIENVKRGQRESIKFTGYSIDVDGKYGPETKRNKIRVLQIALNKDYCGPDAYVKRCYDEPLVIDGEWGPKSDAALGWHYICRGETQFMVTAMEICAYLGGNDPHGVEYPGTYGSGLASVMEGDFCSTDVFRFCFVVV